MEDVLSQKFLYLPHLNGNLKTSSWSEVVLSG